jgi:anti-sigma factor RsiW
VTPQTPHLTEEQAQELVDGLLAPFEAEPLAAHAAACSSCQARVEAYRSLCQALDTLPLPELPADFTDGVLDRVDAQERARARERRTAVAVVAGTLGALVAALAAAGARTWIPAAAHLVDDLGAAARAVRFGLDVLPPVVAALRIPIAVACAAFTAPVLYALSRLTTSPRTEIA